MTAINVYQKDWAFTCSDAKKPVIKTGMFSSCSVVTFSCDRYAALAHLDVSTDVQSLTDIFNEFTKCSIELRNIKAVILGGREDCPLSKDLHTKVISIIKEYDIEIVNIQNMYSKNTPHLDRETLYQFGAEINAITGKTVILKDEDIEFGKEQLKRLLVLLELKGIRPLNRVT